VHDQHQVVEPTAAASVSLTAVHLVLDVTEEERPPPMCAQDFFEGTDGLQARTLELVVKIQAILEGMEGVCSEQASWTASWRACRGP